MGFPTAGCSQGFEAGARVHLTVRRGQVREVVGEEHVWREHFPAAGEITVVAAMCVPLHRPIRTPRSTVTWSMSETRTVSFIVQAPSSGRVRSLVAQ